MESISATGLDEPINSDKSDLSNQSRRMDDKGQPQMIALDSIEKGLIWLSSINSEKFEKLLTSEDFIDDLNEIHQGAKQEL